MRIVDDFSTTPPLEVLEPADLRLPFVYSSPHSGRAYPRSFLAASRLSPLAIRRSEDAFVDDLFLPVVRDGAPMVRAHFPRAFLDVNREPYELDPKMFAGRLPAYANIRSVRVAGGLGTIARVVADSEEIYASPLDVAEALARIEALYKPYHATLRRVVTRTQARFGFAVLVDCHSMPSQLRGQDPRTRPDVILGDRYGTSAAPELVETAAAILGDLGLLVGRNRPYAGGFITEHYGRPAQGVHALQIEINRGLYMDETGIVPSPGFAATAVAIATFCRRLAAAVEGGLDSGRAAAAE
jgi:N-formylglutamate amidohydrolase